MSVVVMLQGRENADRSTSQLGLLLARHLNASLEGICALPDPALALITTDVTMGTGLSASTLSSVSRLQDELIANAKGAFCDTTDCGAHGLAVSFRHETALPAHAAAGSAVLADALILPRSAARASEPLAPAFENTLLRTRLPVILAGSLPVHEGPVIIAWDGSPAAARALRFHAHHLPGFKDIIIAQNEDDARRGGEHKAHLPDKIQAWLKFRGLQSRSMPLTGDVGGSLLSLAKSTGAAMIIAGAFGHSRLGEFIFGGTSRQLLSAADAPALALSH